MTWARACYEARMTSLREFIALRRFDLQRELQELDLAEQMLSVSPTGATLSNGSRMTLTQMTLDVLRDYPQGADKRAIQDLIHQKHGVRPATNSLTTQLSRLKGQHVLSLDGRVWRVNGRGRVE
jgi:hypothetical protein